MAQYIPKDELLAVINKRITDAPINNIGHQRVWAYNDVKDILDILEVREVQEVPVSEDLEKMSYHSAMDLINNPKFLPTTTFGELIPMLQKLYKDGAKWQKEQFEKNRLAACDAQTEEEAHIERDFVMGIIENEHRQPTFDDAIKYGRRVMV